MERELLAHLSWNVYIPAEECVCPSPLRLRGRARD